MSGRLTLVTAPTVEPVDLDDVKTHLRVDSTSDDELIDALIISAREHAETFTGRALCTQTWDYKLDAFCGDELRLPKAPTSSVTSITYVDSNGTTQTWSTDEWDADTPSGPHAQKGRIYPAYSYSWPTVRSIPNAITVRFVAGYGGASSVPSSIKSAIKLLVGHWYLHRESVIVGNVANVVPQSVDTLLWPFRVF